MENIVTNRAKSRERLSRNIQIIKDTFHLTTNDFARHVGIEKHTMAIRLKCPHLLTWENLEGIAELGNVTMEELASGDLAAQVRVVDLRKKKNTTNNA